MYVLGSNTTKPTRQRVLLVIVEGAVATSIFELSVSNTGGFETSLKNKKIPTPPVSGVLSLYFLYKLVLIEIFFELL